jgi:hypothetical protein
VQHAFASLRRAHVLPQLVATSWGRQADRSGFAALDFVLGVLYYILDLFFLKPEPHDGTCACPPWSHGCRRRRAAPAVRSGRKCLARRPPFAAFASADFTVPAAALRTATAMPGNTAPGVRLGLGMRATYARLSAVPPSSFPPLSFGYMGLFAQIPVRSPSLVRRPQDRVAPRATRSSISARAPLGGRVKPGHDAVEDGESGVSSIGVRRGPSHASACRAPPAS